LLQDGTVYSVQRLVLPGRCAGLVTAHLLLERYLRLVRHFTLSLVRPELNADGIRFRLVGTSLALLSFSPPEYQIGERSEAVHLRTVGGLLVRAGEPGRGKFSFLAEPEEGGVRVTVQLYYSRPFLLGSQRPSLLRRMLFSSTQGAFHKAITVRYLKDLCRELTGSSVKMQVKQVHVLEGEKI
jgi:hypothetical protein